MFEKTKKKPRIPNEPRVRNLCAIYPDSFAESTAEVLVAREVRSTSLLLSPQASISRPESGQSNYCNQRRHHHGHVLRQSHHRLGACRRFFVTDYEVTPHRQRSWLVFAIHHYCYGRERLLLSSGLAILASGSLSCPSGHILSCMVGEPSVSPA